MNRSEIIEWLVQDDAAALERLWRRADRIRREHVGDEVHLRGLVEISNHCRRQCHYCGLRAGNTRLARYRMTAGEILDCARQAVEFDYGTVVLQAGEDAGLEAGWMAGIIRAIKAQTPLAVTLSLGERADDELALWRQAGADRYLLRFETSNLGLYERIHPATADCELRNANCELPGNQGRRQTPDDPQFGFHNSQLEHPRFAILRRLRELGYEIGSGVMIGIPGQTYEDLARDIEAFAELDLEMIGVGPFLPHPRTPLGELRSANCEVRIEGATNGPTRGNSQFAIHNPQSPQVPNDELTTYKVVALARLICPDANIPSTTALATLNRADGRELGLARGANVVMPNLTPPQYRAMYEIYPAKACTFESAGECHDRLAGRIAAMARRVGTGRGDSPRRISMQRARRARSGKIGVE
ncbi:MAG: radical SAM protein [Phycisphaerae bacterium]